MNTVVLNVARIKSIVLQILIISWIDHFEIIPFPTFTALSEFKEKVLENRGRNNKIRFRIRSGLEISVYWNDIELILKGAVTLFVYSIKLRVFTNRIGNFPS